jgi:hypothetical protein
MATSPPYPQTPVLDMGVAAAVLIVNVLVPGLGTLIAGIVGSKPMIGRAIAQFLLSIIVIGWIWGIVTGVQALTNASWSGKQPVPQ